MGYILLAHIAIEIGYKDTGIQGYNWIQEYKDTRIQGYRNTGIQGYNDIKLQEYRIKRNEKMNR